MNLAGLPHKGGAVSREKNMNHSDETMRQRRDFQLPEGNNIEAYRKKVARAAPKMTIFSNLTMLPPEGVLVGGATGAGDDPAGATVGGLGGLALGDVEEGVAVGGEVAGAGLTAVGAGVEAGGGVAGLGAGAALGETVGAGGGDTVGELAGAGPVVDVLGAADGALGVAAGAVGFADGALAGEVEGLCAQQLPPIRPKMSATVIIVFNAAIVLR